MPITRRGWVLVPSCLRIYVSGKFKGQWQLYPSMCLLTSGLAAAHQLYPALCSPMRVLLWEIIFSVLWGIALKKKKPLSLQSKAWGQLPSNKARSVWGTQGAFFPRKALIFLILPAQEGGAFQMSRLSHPGTTGELLEQNHEESKRCTSLGGRTPIRSTMCRRSRVQSLVGL